MNPAQSSPSKVTHAGCASLANAARASGLEVLCAAVGCSKGANAEKREYNEATEG